MFGAVGVNVWLTIDYWHMKRGMENDRDWLRREREIRCGLMLMLWDILC